jgi:hypothetical protein
MVRKTVWPGWVVVTVLVGAAAAGVMLWAPPRPLAVPAAVVYRQLLPAGGYPDRPLAVGTPVPPLVAQGWANGPPPPRAGQVRLVVLDIWSDS